MGLLDIENILESTDNDIKVIEKYIKSIYNITGKLDIYKCADKFIVNCDGSVSISNSNIDKLDNNIFKWGSVGNFMIYNCNNIRQLKGVPEYCKYFYISGCNSLKSLKYGPKFVECEYEIRNCKNLHNSNINTICININILNCIDDNKFRELREYYRRGF